MIIRHISLLLFLLAVSSIKLVGQTLKIIDERPLIVPNRSHFKTLNAQTVETVNNGLFSVVGRGKRQMLLNHTVPEPEIYAFNEKLPKIVASSLGETKQLLLFGTGESKKARKVIIVPPSDIQPGRTFKQDHTVASVNNFYKKLRRIGINRVNLQAATLVGSQIILASVQRSTQMKPGNILIPVAPDFYNHQETLPSNTGRYAIKPFSGSIKGELSITGLTFVPKTKMLIYSAVLPIPNNRYHSFLGWISDFEEKFKNGNLQFNEGIRVTLSEDFYGQRIEDVAFKRIDDNNVVTLSLISADYCFTVTLDTKK